MVVNRVLTYALLAAITVVPWNATAVNRYSLSNLLPKSAVNGTFKEVGQVAGNLTESLLVKSLLEITQGKNQQALDTINQLLQTTPNFKLAHLVRGDLLQAQTN
jgi:hypothetical protein